MCTHVIHKINVLHAGRKNYRRAKDSGKKWWNVYMYTCTCMCMYICTCYKRM